METLLWPVFTFGVVLLVGRAVGLGNDEWEGLAAAAVLVCWGVFLLATYHGDQAQETSSGAGRTQEVVYESAGDWLTRACGSNGVRQWDAEGKRNRYFVAVCGDGRVVDSNELRPWRIVKETDNGGAK